MPPAQGGGMESIMKKIVIDLKNYIENGSVFKRTAVRGIIKKDGKYLIIHSKYGDYKFPGGGKHEEEQIIDTLVREVQEETGYVVKTDTAHAYMEVYERRKGNPDDLMEMTSYYYFCEVKEDAGDRNLDDYEAEYDYQVEWLPLEEIIRRNKSVQDMEFIPWVVRETKVMEQLLKDQKDS